MIETMNTTDFSAVIAEYERLHPNAESLGPLLFHLTMDEVVALIKKAKGREIVLTDDPNALDGLDWHFKK